MMKPVIDEIAEESAVPVHKIDVDAHPDLAAEFGVRAVPTYIVFRDGVPDERLVGQQPKEVLQAALGS